MKYQIMVKILMQLLSKRKLTAGEIADRYEISVRTAYRYVEELIVSGIPIDVDRGRYGGISIADTFKLPAGYFTREEYAAAVNALTAMASQVSDANVFSALEKMKSNKRFERRELSVCANIIVDGGAWGGAGNFSEKMAICERAANERRSLSIDYYSREGVHSKRIIDVHVLILKQNVWYVYAFCHSRQKFLTFKIGRIKSATLCDAVFERREFTRDDIPLNFTYSSEQLTEVELEIKKSGLADAEEWLGIDNIETRGEGFVAKTVLPDDDGLVNKILSYGGAVKVLSPPELRQKVIAAARKIAAQ